MTVQAIPIELIRTDGGTQIRDCKTMQTKIDEYVLAMHGRADFPPLTVFWDGEHYWLADGFHRHGAYNVIMQAFKMPGLNIPCEVIEGSQRDAIIYACGVNSAHGMPRTNPDKQNAVRTMLTNPLVMIDLETGKPWNDVEIARRCVVSDRMVAKHRADLAAERAKQSIIETFDDSERTVTRGGTTYVMKTANIGKKAEQPGGDADVQPSSNSAAPPADAGEAPAVQRTSNSAAPDPQPEPAKTAAPRIGESRPIPSELGGEVVQFTSPHDYLYDLLAEIDRAMAKLPAPDVAAADFPSTLAHALPTERVVDIKHWWLDFTRFWAAREPEFLRRQQRQMDFIKEELNVNPR